MIKKACLLAVLVLTACDSHMECRWEPSPSIETQRACAPVAGTEGQWSYAYIRCMEALGVHQVCYKVEDK